MARFLSKAGLASKVTLAMIVLLALFAITLSSVKTTAQPSGPETNAAERARYLHLTGLTPECLCAAGLSTSDVTSAISDAVAVIETNAAELVAAETALLDTERELDELTRLIRSGTASTEQKNSLSTVTAAAQTAESDWQGLLDEIHDAGCGDVTTAEADRIAVVLGNDRWSLPVEYKRASRTEAEWVALRNALAAERIAAADGDDLDSSFETLLLNVRAEAGTAQAMSWISSNLEEIKTAYNDALDG